MNYEIAGFTVSLSGCCEKDEVWDRFAAETKQADLSIVRGEAEMYYGVSCLKASTYPHVLCVNQGLVRASEDWTHAELYAASADSVRSLINAVLMTYASSHETLLMHGSLVSYADQGILFTGPSGIGKTTQAELWNQYLDASILNGDMVYIRKDREQFLGCGSPWHGSSSYCLNEQVPLKAIIVLHQSPVNTIRRMNGMDISQAILPQVFLPHWDPKCAEKCLDTLQSMLDALPVYELSCRPDEEAVLITKQMLGL